MNILLSRNLASYWDLFNRFSVYTMLKTAREKSNDDDDDNESFIVDTDIW